MHSFRCRLCLLHMRGCDLPGLHPDAAATFCRVWLACTVDRAVESDDFLPADVSQVRSRDEHDLDIQNMFIWVRDMQIVSSKRDGSHSLAA